MLAKVRGDTKRTGKLEQFITDDRAGACRYFRASGTCRFGSDCRRVHNSIVQPAATGASFSFNSAADSAFKSLSTLALGNSGHQQDESWFGQRSWVLNRQHVSHDPSRHQSVPTSPSGRSEPGGWRFSVMTYNILADQYAHQFAQWLYRDVPKHCLTWQHRRPMLVREMLFWAPDVICLQEVQHYADIEEDLKQAGYEGVFLQRPGRRRDGCATFWRSSRFRLRDKHCINFLDHSLADNVALLLHLQPIGQPTTTAAAAQAAAGSGQGGSPGSSSSVDRAGGGLLVANTHICFDPNKGDVKLGQVRTLINKIAGLRESWAEPPVAVMAGDFNMVPACPIYNFINKGELDVGTIPQRRLSGQVKGYGHRHYFAALRQKQQQQQQQQQQWEGAVGVSATTATSSATCTATPAMSSATCTAAQSLSALVELWPPQVHFTRTSITGILGDILPFVRSSFTDVPSPGTQPQQAQQVLAGAASQAASLASSSSLPAAQASGGLGTALEAAAPPRHQAEVQVQHTQQEQGGHGSTGSTGSTTNAGSTAGTSPFADVAGTPPRIMRSLSRRIEEVGPPSAWSTRQLRAALGPQAAAEIRERRRSAAQVSDLPSVASVLGHQPLQQLLGLMKSPSVPQGEGHVAGAGPGPAAAQAPGTGTGTGTGTGAPARSSSNGSSSIAGASSGAASIPVVHATAVDADNGGGVGSGSGSGCLSQQEPATAPGAVPEETLLALHPLQLRSSYFEVLGAEPLFSSVHHEFLGTCDYIWYTPSSADGSGGGLGGGPGAGGTQLRPVAVLAPPLMEALPRGLPAQNWASDHVCLVTDFVLEGVQ